MGSDVADIRVVTLAKEPERTTAEATAASNDRTGKLSVLSGAVCAFGVFDGLHRGHKVIFDETFSVASKLGAPSIALTFDIDPDEMFDPSHQKLMSNDARLSELADAGFDHVVAFRFDEGFASMEPVEFLDRAFVQNLPSAMVVGPDLRFGRQGSGDVAMLEDWGDAHGMEVSRVELLEEGGSPIKSTRIRKLLESGDAEAATLLLGHPYEVPEWSLDLDQRCSGSQSAAECD